MNKKIELFIENAHTWCLYRMKIDMLSHEELFKNELVNTYLPLMYNNDLDNELKLEYSFDTLKEDILELIKPKIPTQAIAEDKLETWLDSSIRTNDEHRFDAYKKLLVKENKKDIITQIDADTYKILDSCHNPN